MAIVSYHLARRHEALVIRLDLLVKEVQPIARKSPGATVPAAVRTAAEALLFDAQPFAGKGEGRGRGFPDAAAGRPSLTWAALAVSLAGLRATLDTFEAAHSLWDDTDQCLCWRLQGEPLPIARLAGAHGGGRRPGGGRAGALGSREGERMRNALLLRIDAKITAAYDKGYADALAGRPSDSAPSTVAAIAEQVSQG